MAPFSFKKLDAFAAQGSSGNPAGVVYLEPGQEITKAQMLAMAQQLAGFVSEVAYVRRPEPGRLELRYYSAEREVDFCGHATIALCHDLLSNDPELSSLSEVALSTGKAQLTVRNRIAHENAVYLAAPEPRHTDWTPDRSALAQALDTSLDALSLDLAPAKVNGGLETLLIPLASLEAVLTLRPDLETLKAYLISQGADIALVYSEEVADPACLRRTRVFAATFGYLEDPATGSGNAALGYHLLNQGWWDGQPVQIEQGPQREPSNRVRLSYLDGHLWIGGGAQCRIEGTYYLE